VSERLRALRWQRGLPIHLLAQRAGVSAGELLMWEQRGVAPAREIVQRVAQVLGVGEHELIREG
jgi:transcriptional regulator with XRE-family HTH domain